jgi:superfamily I DNA/RNA helicase
MARTYKKTAYKKRPEIQAKKFVMKYPASERQIAIGAKVVELLKHRGNANVKAVAGSGKTTACCYVVFDHIPKHFLKCALGGSIKILFTSFANAIVDSVKPYFANNANMEASGMHKLGKGSIYKSFGYHKVDNSGYKVQNILTENWPSIFDAWNCGDEEEKSKRFSACSAMKKLIHFIKVSLTDPSDEVAVLDLVYHFGIDLEGQEAALLAVLPKAIEINDANTSFIDFDDMLRFPIIYNLKMPQYDLVIGDEDQDYSTVMHLLIAKMIEDGGVFLGVGDEFQAIYGFAGADCDSVRNLVKTLNCEELLLDVNYRCGKSIIKHAQGINPIIQPWENSPEGAVISMKYEDAIESGIPGDMFIHRKNPPLIGPCYRKIRDKTPATIKGNDVSEMIVNLHKKVCKKAKNIPDADSMITDYYDREFARLEKSKYSSKSTYEALSNKVEILKEFYNVCSEEGHGPDHVPKMIESIFSKDIKAGHVNFTTAHSSKGLEANRVVILDYPEIEINHPDMKDWQRKQERHAHYVAVTRAMKELVLVDPKE